MDVYAQGPEVARMMIASRDKEFVESALNAAITHSECEARVQHVRYHFSEGSLRQARMQVCADILARLVIPRNAITLRDEEARIGYEYTMQGLRLLSHQPHRLAEAEVGYSRIRYRT